MAMAARNLCRARAYKEVILHTRAHGTAQHSGVRVYKFPRVLLFKLKILF